MPDGAFWLSDRMARVSGDGGGIGVATGEFLTAIPMGASPSPKRPAAVGFFASDEASSVTVEVLLVDGGRP